MRALERTELKQRHAVEPICVTEMLCSGTWTRIVDEFRFAAAPARIKLREVGRPVAGEDIDGIGVRRRALLKLCCGERRTGFHGSRAKGGSGAPQSGSRDFSEWIAGHRDSAVR